MNIASMESSSCGTCLRAKYNCHDKWCAQVDHISSISDQVGKRLVKYDFKNCLKSKR